MLSHQGISEEATDITILFAGVDTRGTPKDPKSHGSLFETLAKFGHGREFGHQDYPNYTDGSLSAGDELIFEEEEEAGCGRCR